MDEQLQDFAASFVESTRDYVFIRPEDNLLILRPNRVHNLNATATAMLHTLYNQEQVDVAGLVSQAAARYRVPEPQVAQDEGTLRLRIAPQSREPRPKHPQPEENEFLETSYAKGETDRSQFKRASNALPTGTRP